LGYFFLTLGSGARQSFAAAGQVVERIRLTRTCSELEAFVMTPKQRGMLRTPFVESLGVLSSIAMTGS